MSATCVECGARGAPEDMFGLPDEMRCASCAGRLRARLATPLGPAFNRPASAARRRRNQLLGVGAVALLAVVVWLLPSRKTVKETTLPPPGHEIAFVESRTQALELAAALPRTIEGLQQHPVLGGPGGVAVVYRAKGSDTDVLRIMIQDVVQLRPQDLAFRKRSTERVAGYPIVLGDGQLSALVGDRFYVTVSGRTQPARLRHALTQVDLARLASLAR